MKNLLLVLILLVLAAPGARAGEPDDGLRATALDYAMSWYTADGDRMEGALHPELAKRILQVDPETGERTLRTMGASDLVEATRKGWGAHIPASEQRADVTILDVYGNAAVVKVVMHDWVDYLQMVKMKERWVIANVLWEMTPEAKAKMKRGD